MPRYKMLYDSEEEIYGVVTKTGDWVQYKGRLKIKSGGKQPVSLDLKIVPPHPTTIDMPEKYNVKTVSVSEAYAKVSKFLKKFGVEFRT